MTLHIMRGISGSGKTTLANTLDAVRVSRDDIRSELSGSVEKFVGDVTFESRVSRVQKERVRDLLIARKNVVIDDTNLRKSFLQAWVDMAQDYGHEYQIHTLEVGVDEAIENDRKRFLEGGASVGQDVIRKQASRAYFGPVEPTHPFVDWTPLEYDDGLPSLVTCDLDGTLAIMPTGYSPYDPAHYPSDKVDQAIQSVLSRYYYDLDLDVNIGFLTGREDTYRGVVNDWLLGFVGMSGDLWMRKAGDKRRDDVVKVELVNENIRGKYNVLFHMDDRDRVVKALRAIGIKVFQVAEGNF